MDPTNADIVGDGCPTGSSRGAAFHLYTTVGLTLRSVATVDNGASGGAGGAVYSDFGNVTIDARAYARSSQPTAIASARQTSSTCSSCRRPIRRRRRDVATVWT